MSDTDENRPTLEGSFWLGLGGSAWLSDLRVRLLEAIESRGSLTGAAQAIGISYKSAWEQVEAMTNLADRPLVIRRSGGAGGGGAELTDEARALLRWYDTVAVEHRRFLARVAETAPGFPAYYQLPRRLAMNTSARNQYAGVVRSIHLGPISAEVAIALDSNDEIVAVVTHRSVENLGLKEGIPVFALVKASSVTLVAGTGEGVRTSARNVLRGKVETLAVGPVNAEVTMRLTGGKYLTATITGESATRLGLAEGETACALIKASSVILATN
jgi:molybdate transport system regulatory protein